MALADNSGNSNRTAAQRKRYAEYYYAQGKTQQVIANMLGVSQYTISMDLKEFNLLATNKLSHAKTASNPKGAGRPKGTGGMKKGKKKRTGPQSDRRVDQPEAASLVLDEGFTYEKAAEKCDVSLQVVRASVAREEGRREGPP